MSFIDGIKKRARRYLQTIIFPESEDDRILLAASEITEEQLAKVVLLGHPETIAKSENRLHISLTNVSVIDPTTSSRTEQYSDILYNLRKGKGMTHEQAEEIVRTNPTVFGILMVYCGEGDGLISGACHSTADTLRPALQILKTAPGKNIASSFFIMDVPDCTYGSHGIFLFADCALNQDPTSEQLADIAHNSAEMFEALVEKQARIAFLSHSTKGSAKHPLVDKVQQAVALTHERYPAHLCDGELQLDAAIISEIAAVKAPESPLKGTANLLIFPNIDAGNIGYKLVQRLAKAEAYGPILAGLAAPVNDLSRGCHYQDIVGVAAITAVQAQILKNL